MVGKGYQMSALVTPSPAALLLAYSFLCAAAETKVAVSSTASAFMHSWQAPCWCLPAKTLLISICDPCNLARMWHCGTLQPKKVCQAPMLVCARCCVLNFASAVLQTSSAATNLAVTAGVLSNVALQHTATRTGAVVCLLLC